jgi:hypothetical protein
VEVQQQRTAVHGYKNAKGISISETPINPSVCNLIGRCETAFHSSGHFEHGRVLIPPERKQQCHPLHARFKDSHGDPAGKADICYLGRVRFDAVVQQSVQWFIQHWRKVSRKPARSSHFRRFIPYWPVDSLCKTTVIC